MSAVPKIGLGVLLVELSWSLYAWRAQERAPEVTFPSEDFVPVWQPAEVLEAGAVQGEVLLFFSPAVVRTADFWGRGGAIAGFRAVGILEDRSCALAWRYATGTAFPFGIWWDSLPGTIGIMGVCRCRGRG